jgi:hypothetical protein
MSDYDEDDIDDEDGDESDLLDTDNGILNASFNLDELAEELMEVISRYPELSDNEKDHLISLFPSLLE